MRVAPHQFQQLVGGQKFIFVFVPEGVGGVTDEFVRLFAAKALPGMPPADLDWVISPVPAGTDEQKRSAMGKVVTEWLGRQSAPHSVRFDQKVVTVPTNVETEAHLTCLIAYLQPR